MSEPPNRRPCITEKVGRFAVTVSYLPDKRAHNLCGAPCEVFITERAKSGTEMEDLLYRIGVTASRLMQHEYRDDE